MIFYFSGTGNSAWIAKTLSLYQHEKLIFIPNALQYNLLQYTLQKDEKIGFVFPIYSWAPPIIVQRFIDQVTLLGYEAQYTFFICSCGDDIGLTQQVMERLLSAKGLKCNAGFSVAMPNNYVLLPGFDVDTKDVEQRKLKEAVPRMIEINDQIEKRRSVFSCTEGSLPYLKTRLINPLFVRYQMFPKHFYSTEACISCGKCVKSCPVRNIKLIDGRPVWGENCTSCLACYHICPKQAVQYGKKTKNKGQYFNPNSTY